MRLFIYDFIETIQFWNNWEKRTILHKSYTVLLVGYFLALLPMPYEYYITLRLVTCLALFFFFQKIKEVRDNHPFGYYGIIFLFFLYNPVIPVHTGSQLFWFISNILTLYFLYNVRQIFESENNTET